MLQELSIKNFAIISSLSLGFESGMTVLTGETGAGKSIIIDALGLLVGGRGSNDYIRQGESKCVLEGLFYIEKQTELHKVLEELSIETEDHMLILQREIFQSGKNVCRVNGHLVNTAILRKIGGKLVDIHGQNEHQELMKSERHLFLLDEYAKEQIQPLLNNYQQAFQKYRELAKKLKQKEQNEQTLIQRLDMLKFQVKEIEDANLQIGEETLLAEERGKLVNYQKIAEALQHSYALLEGTEAAGSVDQVGTAMNEMLDIASLDNEFSRIADNISNAYFLLQEAANDLSSQIDFLEMDENRLLEIEDRLHLIRQLERKYGETIEDVLQYYETISAELADIEFLDDSSEQLAVDCEKARLKMVEAADQLTTVRKKAAKELETKIVEQLKSLYLEKTQFEVRFLDKGGDEPHFSEEGQDKVEFYISTNPGEPLKPLVKVVSGGELSRVMLALKTIFSQSQQLTSIIFDEVDTGVSGRVAQSIAEKIHQVSINSQVLCITHLPQVAAVADQHYFIEKEVVDGRTETSVRPLTLAEREIEIARMLAGTEVTPLTLEHAKELLKMAQNHQ